MTLTDRLQRDEWPSNCGWPAHLPADCQSQRSYIQGKMCHVFPGRDVTPLTERARTAWCGVVSNRGSEHYQLCVVTKRLVARG
jgi:hypothetical protein